MAKPKLALIPATQGSKLYSVLPADGVGDFTFSRGSAATRINKDGLIETVAVGKSRLNYPLIDGVVNGCPSHLLEPSRTNFITYSNGFTDSSWLKTGSTVVSGVISPDGTNNAFTLSNTASSGIIQKAVSITGTRVLSIFAKEGTHRYLRMGAYGGTNSYANFDLQNGVVANGANANIENYGNGWFRCTCHSVSGTTGGVQIFPSNNTTGAATTNGSIQIYGVHLQQASTGEINPTSYIPTTSASVTRSAETAIGAGDASTFNDSEGVLMAETSTLADLDDTGYIALNAGTNFVNSLLIQYTNSGELRIYNGGTLTPQMIYLDTSLDLSENIKIAIKYGTTSSSYKVYINGFSKTIESAFVATTMSGLDNLKFTDANGSGSPFYGNTKQIQYFDSALNDSDLETLTSWTSFTDMANGQLYSIK